MSALPGRLRAARGWATRDPVLFPAGLAIFLLLLWLREPGALGAPQFFAEDGSWFAQAYRGGAVSSLAMVHGGYPVLLQRLGALIAGLAPVTWAPLLYAAIGLLAGALPAAFFLLDRCSPIVADRGARIVAALFYVALPNGRELHANLTNAMWHLAVLACLVLVARVPRSALGRALDLCALVVAGLSGPFSIMLAPVAFVMWFREQRRWRLAVALLVSSCAAITAAVLLTSGGSGRRPPLGASVSALLELLGGQIGFGLLFGARGYAERVADSSVILVAGAAVALLLVAALVRGPLELRLLIGFALAIFASALLLPAPGVLPTTYWELLALPGAAGRYWHALTFATVVILVRAASTGYPAVRAAAAALLVAVAALGVAGDWSHDALPPQPVDRALERLESAQPGEQISIPTSPSGWSVTVTKRDE